MRRKKRDFEEKERLRRGNSGYLVYIKPSRV